MGPKRAEQCCCSPCTPDICHIAVGATAQPDASSASGRRAIWVASQHVQCRVAQIRLRLWYAARLALASTRPPALLQPSTPCVNVVRHARSSVLVHFAKRQTNPARARATRCTSSNMRFVSSGVAANNQASPAQHRNWSMRVPAPIPKPHSRHAVVRHHPTMKDGRPHSMLESSFRRPHFAEVCCRHSVGNPASSHACQDGFVRHAVAGVCEVNLADHRNLAPFQASFHEASRYGDRLGALVGLSNAIHPTSASTSTASRAPQGSALCNTNRENILDDTCKIVMRRKARKARGRGELGNEVTPTMRYGSSASPPFCKCVPLRPALSEFALLVTACIRTCLALGGSSKTQSTHCSNMVLMHMHMCALPEFARRARPRGTSSRCVGGAA